MSSQFGFLPWMRRGIVSKITQVDGTTSPTLERGEIQVDVTLQGQLLSGGTTTDVISNPHVKLYGPGDILGIDPNVVVRCEPADGSVNFEDNYLAYIEFYDEDFLWRYTPAVADSADKLRPWLALIVLKDSEYGMSAPLANGLPPVINIGSSYITSIFHDPAEHWAWGHVCVTNPDPGSSTSPTSADYINNLINDLSTQPDIAVCRLLCPRRLAPNTHYSAFLIPTFETGRLAGLSLNPSIGTVPSLQASWNLTTSSPTQFPVYHQWKFSTGSQGDFETLARALKPQVMDPSLGGRKMDISNSGMGLNALFPGVIPTTVTMEGALMPSTFTPATPKDASSSDAYTTDLKNILNLPATIKNTAYTPPYSLPPYTTSSPHPYVSSTIDDDPIVTPPVYGQWHADVQTLNTSSPKWLQQLNLDPRYRAAAGLGAQTVRNNKQAYMQIAWEQIGDVLLVNDKINKLRAAVQASQRIFNKHFVGNATRAVTTPNAKANNFTKIGGISFKKLDINTAPYIPVSGPSVASYSGHIAASTASSFTNMTSASVNSGFRKITRNRSFVIGRLNSGGSINVNHDLIANINLTLAPVAPVFSTPPAILTTNAYTTATEAANALNNSSPFASVNSATWNLVYVPPPPGSSYNAFNGTINYYNAQQHANQIVLVPMQIGIGSSPVDFAGKVQTALTPSTTITARIAPQIALEVPTGPPPTLNLNQLIMAYPIIDEPMYEQLLSISTEYFLPNLAQYPNNIVTVLETNNRFIESYMAGLNYEFAKELLWQQYPTDQRGSYFRRFWDINDTVDTGTSADFLYDIDPIHKWGTYFPGQVLGDNNFTTRHHSTTSGYLVLLIRGDLLKKYPNVLIYAQKADPAHMSPPHTLYNPATLLDLSGNPDPSIVRFPIFKSSLQPDVVLLGFNLTRSDALGDHVTNPGWFFVFRERPGQMRFGLEEPPPLSGPLTSWDELTWGVFGSSPSTISISSVTPSVSGDPISWGGNAASMAYILYREPVMLAIHAESMLV